MGKIFFLLVFGILFISFSMSIIQKEYSKLKNNFLEDKVDAQMFQGPVPLGYDINYFRKTGYTIKNKEDSRW